MANQESAGAAEFNATIFRKPVGQQFEQDRDESLNIGKWDAAAAAQLLDQL
jgi:hypothetical protein